MKQFDVSLYLVTNSLLSLGRSLADVVEEAVKGGVTMVQLREKHNTTKAFYLQALKLKACLKSYKIPLIINDRIDIALACDADGLHIGQNDMPYTVARQLLGKSKIIGLSVESIQDAMDANLLDVDYIGISPVFDTDTKTDTLQAFGLDGIREVAQITRHPSVAIGGINHTNARKIIAAGANGISVVSAIMSAIDPKASAAQFKQIITKNK